MSLTSSKMLSSKHSIFSTEHIVYVSNESDCTEEVDRNQFPFTKRPLHEDHTFQPLKRRRKPEQDMISKRENNESDHARNDDKKMKKELVNQEYSPRDNNDNHDNDETTEKINFPQPHEHAKANPDAYFKLLFEAQFGFQAKTTSTKMVEPGFFLTPTDEQLAEYTTEVLFAAQDEDMETIRKIHSEGNSLQCCNRFGESLLHMACRRGLTKLVNFLLNEACLSLRVKDDYGRTPLHDACWNRFQNCEIVKMLIEKEPSLLCVADNRGFTPFSYSRMEHWASWKDFLYKHKDVLKTISDASEVFDKLK